MKKVDYKKRDKVFYQPKTQPMLIEVPEMTFIMIDGKGDPNTCAEYKEACEILYGLSYAIKMSPKSNVHFERYFDYVVPPLEGLWCHEQVMCDGKIENKEDFHWTSMIRQPEFVTEEVFVKAKEILHKKKPKLDLSIARLEKLEEGLCAQIMHIGAYDDEPQTIRKMQEFIKEQGYEEDISATRKHHEIYLGDPRKTAPEKLKTVIRHPIKSIG
ncbi:MAG: GyrI-like domain-containing protein [Cellulosilyticum sp.]|nr:GyrI-like domain-containing protein [Cellulosilyticum sp.]